jgi:serine/threonine protein kinase
MPEWIGKTIGKVRIEKFLARGGMAEVYLGTHITLARPVAVKVLHSFIEEEPIPLERFQREARVVAGLRHPNIVQIFDFDTIDSHPYIVMEYLKGPTLVSYLQHQRKQRIPHPQVARLLNGLAAAVDYAHERGVIHRDIKPANILLHNKTDEIPLDQSLPEDVEGVLTDFGLVRLVDTGTHTTSDIVSGTPAYMSPEQALGVKLDHRTDIYSLGIVLYELLAGRVPFTAEHALVLNMQIHEMQIHAIPPPIPELPARVQAVLDRALAKNPEDRYQSSHELVIDFSHSIELPAEPEPAPPVPAPPPIQTRPPSEPRSSKPKLVALPADLLASNNARDITAITIKGNQNAVATQGGRASVIHSGGTSPVFQAWRERMEREIERLEDLQEEDKALLKQNVEQIAREAEKGEKADPKRIERLLNTLSVMAPGSFEVALTTLTDLFVGIGLVIKKVGDKARVTQKA